MVLIERDDSDYRQMTLGDMGESSNRKRKESLNTALLALQRRYGGDIVKTGNEMIAEKRFEVDYSSKTNKES